WENAQKKLQQAREEQTKAATNKEQANKQLEETKTKKEQVEKQFAAALSSTGLSSEEAYHQATLPETDQKQLKESIEAYKQNLATTKQQVTELQAFLQDKQKVDLKVLESQLAELKRSYENALHKRDESKTYYQEA